MRNFADFNIKPPANRFVGEKIKMMRVLNQEIVIHGFKINKSKFENSNSEHVTCIQIQFKENMHVLFTGSKVLTEILKRVPEDGFPFKATIIKESETFILT